MSKDVITDDGQEIVVREDTAKAFRWNKFIGILLAGILLILIAGILFFTGALVTVTPLSNTANSANQNARAAP